jgi:hypothetical protein
LFFIEIGCRSISPGGITRHLDAEWMQQVARNATMESSGYLKICRYLPRVSGHAESWWRYLHAVTEAE